MSRHRAIKIDVKKFHDAKEQNTKGKRNVKNKISRRTFM